MDIQIGFLDLINALFCEVNPIPVKAALSLMGWEVGKCRPPLCELSDKGFGILKQALWNHGLVE